MSSASIPILQSKRETEGTMLPRKLLRAGVAAFGVTVMGLSSQADPDCACRSALVTSVPVYVPPPTWQGFYIGAHIGGDSGDIGDRRSLQFFFPEARPFFTPEASGSGVFGGLQLGYNWQSSCCFVFGIEVDFGGMDVGLNRQVVAVSNGTSFASFVSDSSAGWYADLTGRLGYSWGRTMLYGKGGVAWFNPNLSVSETVITGRTTALFGNRDGGTLTGWTAGGGFEYKLNPHWTWKLEYMYFDFSNNDNNCCSNGIGNFRFFNSDLTINTVKVGFNYTFDTSLPYLK
jgi:outer membrane immunogenic protein